MDILDDMGVRELSAKVFGKVNYSFNAFGPGGLDLLLTLLQSKDLLLPTDTHTCCY